MVIKKTISNDIHLLIGLVYIISNLVQALIERKVAVFIQT